MFHFAISKFQAESVRGLPIAQDLQFAAALRTRWQTDTEGRLAADLYPLRNCIVFRWDGATPQDPLTCRRLVEEVMKHTPHYLWIDGTEFCYAESAPWDFS